MTDPLAWLTDLEGVRSAYAGTRDGIDVMLRDRGLRRTSPELTAESLLRGAHASAVLEGSASTLEQVRAGEADPPCESCGGILKSATISFGQPLVPEVIDRAMQAASEAELLLAIGTSLQVYPIAGAVTVARDAGARVVIINAEPTPFDGMADAVLRERIGELLPALVGVPSPARIPHERSRVPS